MSVFYFEMITEQIIKYLNSCVYNDLDSEYVTLKRYKLNGYLDALYDVQVLSGSAYVSIIDYVNNMAKSDLSNLTYNDVYDTIKGLILNEN